MSVYLREDAEGRLVRSSAVLEAAAAQLPAPVFDVVCGDCPEVHGGAGLAARCCRSAAPEPEEAGGGYVVNVARLLRGRT